MLRRWLYPYLPERRVWMSHVVALGTAAFVTLVAFIATGKELAELREIRSRIRHHYLPPETICLSPYTAGHKVPEAWASRRPIIRLREYAPYCYELLYWGNPIRPAYSFSVWSLETGAPALLDEQGRTERTRPLPVTVARREDGKLPLQPAVKLYRLSGCSGNLYAARIAVHDAATGTVLATALYLLSGNQEREK